MTFFNLFADKLSSLHWAILMFTCMISIISSFVTLPSLFASYKLNIHLSFWLKVLRDVIESAKRNSRKSMELSPFASKVLQKDSKSPFQTSRCHICLKMPCKNRMIWRMCWQLIFVYNIHRLLNCNFDKIRHNNSYWQVVSSVID